MFSRKKKSTVITPAKPQDPGSEVKDLIVKLQKNADKVEQLIHDVENNLNKDVAKINEGTPTLYCDDCEKKILQCDDLLNSLDADAANAKRLQHPQAEMIESDMKQLRERVLKLREDKEGIYHLVRSEGVPTVNWSNALDDKLDSLNNKGFGEDLPSVENEVEDHNIFHSEVEALAPHIATGGDKDYVNSNQAKYKKLLAASGARQRDLSSLRDYMQRCTNELYWMDQQAEERINYDWSDTNLDYPARKRQYENFISKCLESKEGTVTKLNTDGEKLMDANHPGKNVIEAHMEAVHADWKEYLNLLICEENHLKHMEEYHKYHKDVRDTQDLLKRVEKENNQKFNPEFKDVYQTEALLRELDDQSKAMDLVDQRVVGLQKRSVQVLPLKFRRETPQKLLPVEALCEFDADEGQVVRGERYTLLRNNGSKWDVKDSAGRKLTAPAVCFMIPPTDPEAVGVADSLVNQQKAVKQKINASKDALTKRYDELKRERGAGDQQEQQSRQLLAGLDKVISDLDKQEKAVYAQTRPPLETSRALQDANDRLQELREVGVAVSRIEPEKSSKVRDARALLSSSPAPPNAALLNGKAEEAERKQREVEELLAAAQDRLKTSVQLESSLQTTRSVLSEYENRLAREETAPSDIKGLETTQRLLADMGGEVRSKRPLLAELDQHLRSAKASSDNMYNKFQEHNPDVDRQETDAQRLTKRYNTLQRQLDTRSQSLQRAKMSYNNYNNDYNNLNTWLSRVPNYEPRETDSVQSLDTKLKNQRNLLSDIAKKESDLNNVSRNAQLYQQAIKDYENETEKYKAILEVEDGLVPQSYKRSRLESPALKVKGEEAAIEAKFTEVNAVNKQKLRNLELAQALLNQQPEVAVVQSSVQSAVRSAPGEEPWRVRKQLEEEQQRREQLEREIEVIQTDIYVLEGQKPQDTIVKKELIKKVPDPALDEEIHKVQQRLSEERRSTHSLENELEVLKMKIRSVETEIQEGAQEYMVKEVLRIERDRGQEEEVRRLRDELEELRRQKLLKENDLLELRREVTLLAEEKSREQEVVTEEEVIKVQNDPQLESEYRLLLDRKQKTVSDRKQLEDELSFLTEKRSRLEKEKAMAEEKISIKEVLKVEKDVALEREVESLRRQYEEEKARRRSSQRERADLQRKIGSLEEEKAKVITQEKVREIVRPDPKAENEAAALRLECVEQQRRYTDCNLQLRALQDELTALRNRGPQVEVKEIIKEVIKYKIDPQTERELEALRNDIVDKSHHIEKFEMETRQLRNEIQRWKDTKPQVQTKEVVNEVLQYREDPKTKEEIESLKRKLSDEQKKRLDLERERSAQEDKIRLRKTELSQVREKVVQQEVVKMEEDPVLKAECDSFLQNIGSEQRQRDSLKAELFTLQRTKADLDLQLDELERERRVRREAELEIQRLRLRLHELELRDKENREKVTVKQMVVLQQDPQQEKEHSMMRLQLEEEKHKRTLLEKELSALLQQQVALEKVDLKERVVRTEKVQVERDPEAELEIQSLKRTLEEEKRRKRDLEAELTALSGRFSEMEFTNTKSSKELSYIRDESGRLQQENQRLANEIRKLRSEIEITSKETQLISETAPRSDARNLELRLESLQRELAELRGVTAQKDQEIERLQKNLTAVRTKREQRENHLKRSIVVIDPDTGKEMKPDEAYKLGLIDWNMFVNLQSQECDWEEVTVKGPKGESSSLHDRKSGRKFSIDDALRMGHITERQLQQYLNKELSIQEFAAFVSGKKK